MLNKYIKNIKITRLRKFNSSQAIKILEIRNQENVRINMINTQMIPQKEHFVWFKNILKNKFEYFYLISIKNNISGLLRFSKKNHEVEWSFYLKKEKQKIYGGFVEYIAINKAYRLKKISILSCKVFSHNLGVLSLHKKFGFKIQRKKKYDERILIFLSLFKKNWNVRKTLIKKRLRV